MHLAAALLADSAANVTAAATVGLAVFALIALGSLADARKTRHGQILAELSRRWDDRFILESAELFGVWSSSGTIKLIDALWGTEAKDPKTDEERADYSSNLRAWYKLSAYPNLIETIGVFVEEDVVSEEVVYKMWGPSIALAWREWREPVNHLRDVTRTPEVWQWFEAVGLRMARCEEEARRARTDAQRSQVMA